MSGSNLGDLDEAVMPLSKDAEGFTRPLTEAPMQEDSSDAASAATVYPDDMVLADYTADDEQSIRPTAEANGPAPSVTPIELTYPPAVKEIWTPAQNEQKQQLLGLYATLSEAPYNQTLREIFIKKSIEFYLAWLKDLLSSIRWQIFKPC